MKTKIWSQPLSDIRTSPDAGERRRGRQGEQRRLRAEGCFRSWAWFGFQAVTGFGVEVCESEEQEGGEDGDEVEHGCLGQQWFRLLVRDVAVLSSLNAAMLRGLVLSGDLDLDCGFAVGVAKRRA